MMKRILNWVFIYPMLRMILNIYPYTRLFTRHGKVAKEWQLPIANWRVIQYQRFGRYKVTVIVNQRTVYTRNYKINRYGADLAFLPRYRVGTWLLQLIACWIVSVPKRDTYQVKTIR